MKNTTSNLLFQTVVDVGGLRDGAGEGSLHSAIEGKLVDTTHTHRKKKRRKSRRRVHIKLRPAEPNARVTKMSFSYAREGNAKHHGRCFFPCAKRDTDTVANEIIVNVGLSREGYRKGWAY